MSELKDLLSANKILLLDGATGSMLHSLGMPAGVDPARFCLERQDIVRQMHRMYLEAGSDIILTPTLGGTRYKLPAGIDALDFNRTMAENSARAAREFSSSQSRRVFVGGNIGPCGHFIKPLGDLEPDDLLSAFRTQVRGLLLGGVDLFVIETQLDLAETRLSVAAIRLECNLPIFASMTFEDGVSLTGSRPEVFAAGMANMNIDAVGVNCGVGPEQMLDVVREMADSCNLPILAEPNAGLPELVGDKTIFRLEALPFAKATAAMVRQGAQIVGGCCGTTPEHIAALAQEVRSLGEQTLTSVIRPALGGICLTSRSELVRIGPAFPIALIGERINPTGKKKLSAEFQAGQTALAMEYAKEQIEAGADILDVNVGAPDVDEVDFLPRLTKLLVSRHTKPLCLDSSNPDALLAALPYHPGSALLNSISGEADRLEKLGPACKLWGLPFVLLPLRGANLPRSAQERIAIIEELLTRADALGIPRQLAIIDVLALTAASDPDAPKAALETIAWCAAHGLPTMIGLSNISFGLPARDLVNAQFLSMAAGSGLNALIANPANIRIREARDAANLLLGKDKQAARFIAGYSDWQAGQSATGGPSQAAQKTESAQDAILNGDKDRIVELVDLELQSGLQPYAVINEILIPALNEVGSRYEKKQYFLPQLLSSAEAMQTAFAHLKPLLQSGQGEAKAKIVLATVEGDIHDIGKNIVALMLGNHGYEIIDLGKDAKADYIVQQAEQQQASIIGLSALMTTTMPRMVDTIEMVKARGLKCKVMVGGAVVTEEYARRIGADGYSADAVEAVRLAASLLQKN